MERAFAERMAETGDPVYSAAKAGYAAPAKNGHVLKAKPEIQADIGRRVLAKLTDMEDLAIKTIRDAMTSSTSTWTNKLVAADMVVKRLEKGSEAGAKEPSEMSYDELQSTIRALQIRQAELADKARPIIDLEPSDSGVFE